MKDKNLDTDKPINFSFDTRPTLLQTTTNNQNDKTQLNNLKSSQTNQSNQSNQKTKPINQDQNSVCNKLSVNSNSSTGNNSNSNQKQNSTTAPIQMPAQLPIVYSWEGFENETFTSDVRNLAM